MRREAVELALAELTVTVPVKESCSTSGIRSTRRSRSRRAASSFDSTHRRKSLSGERIHQWLGARLRPGRASSDLERIERQQVFVRSCSTTDLTSRRVLARHELVSATSEGAYEELAQVRSDWSFKTLGPVAPETIDEMMVLVLRKSRLRRLR